MPHDTSTPTHWWEIRLRCESAEESAQTLFDLGLTGVQIHSETELGCYVEDQKRSRFFTELPGLGFQLLSEVRLEEKNWVQECTDLWEPVQIEEIRLLPIREIEVDSARPPARRTIRLVPGEGFGTGHHPSTALAIKLMQSPSIELTGIGRCLDVGSGSGVLSLVAGALFGCRVLGIDNDPLAIRNAELNRIANPEVGALVQNSLGSIERIDGSFELILANIYAEVLCKFSSDFARLLSPGGYLILAGIMSSLAPQVQNAYPRDLWKLIQLEEKEDWTAMIYRKQVE
jgi:ribosomal protein L11 methyltransferase